MVLWFYVQEHPKAQPAVVLILKRLRRQVNSLKSHPTDLEKPGIEPATSGLQDIGFGGFLSLIYFLFLFVCFCCFTSHVNSYGHCGTVSSLNHTFSWAGLSKRLTSNLCTYFRL